MIHSQPQKSSVVPDKWTEIIEDLWKHLPHFQYEEYPYDDNCLKFDCFKLQFINDQEEGDSDSEPWPHQITPNKEDAKAAKITKGKMVMFQRLFIHIH